MKRLIVLSLVALVLSGCAVNVRHSARPENVAYETAESPSTPRPNESERLEKRRKIRTLLREIKGERQ